MDSIASVFSSAHHPTSGVSVFDPTPGTVQNTEAMYQFACTLRGNAGLPAGDTPAQSDRPKKKFRSMRPAGDAPEQAVAIFKEAAARGHDGAMYELVVIYTHRMTTKEGANRSDYQEQAGYYKDLALASLTETGAQRILNRKERGAGSPDDAVQTDRTTTPLAELYEKCAAYIPVAFQDAKFLFTVCATRSGRPRLGDPVWATPSRRPRHSRGFWREPSDVR